MNEPRLSGAGCRLAARKVRSPAAGRPALPGVVCSPSCLEFKLGNHLCTMRAG